MKGDSEVVDRVGERVSCPVCGGVELDFHYEGDLPVCTACDGVGEVCVCPVCEGKKETLIRARGENGIMRCPTCKGNDYVRLSEWSSVAVDAGHRRLMEEHHQEVKDKAQEEQDDIARLVVVHRMAMNTVAMEWEKLCKKHEMHMVDAGAFGRTLGGMTVAYFAAMEDELEIERHQVFARFVNGMLHYMETWGDAKGVGVVAGQAGECRAGMQAMDGQAKVKKEDIN